MDKAIQRNTAINYLYRDADNYKIRNRCVLNGLMTEEQINKICLCLDCGEFFIPHVVGLDEERFSEETEADYPWFELGSYSFECTDNRPTTDVTPAQLINAFQKAKDRWEELAEKGECVL